MKLVVLYFFVCSHRTKSFSKENRPGGCFHLGAVFSWCRRFHRPSGCLCWPCTV